MLLKTLLEKEKMLLTSIFSFSHNLVRCSKKFNLLSADAFVLEQLKTLLFRKDLNSTLFDFWLNQSNYP